MNEHKTKALLTNFGTKVFHTVGDADTASFATSHLGQYKETFVQYSPQPRQTYGEEIFGGNSTSGQISQSYQDVLKSVELLTGLRCGGTQSGLLVDGIVIRSGRPFAWGQNYLKLAFNQR